MTTLEALVTSGRLAGRSRAAVRALGAADGGGFMVDLARFGAAARDECIILRADGRVEVTKHPGHAWREPSSFGALDRVTAPCCGADDTVLQALGAALLPALEIGIDATHDFVAHLVRAIGAHLARSARGPEWRTPRLTEWQLRRLQTHIDARVSTAIAVSDLASVCRLSRSHFSRAFKNTIGKTPRHWLTNYRLHRAQALLRGPTTIADIAADCGFADQSHLTRTFSRALGTTPGAFRRTSRKTCMQPFDGRDISSHRTRGVPSDEKFGFAGSGVTT